MQFAEQLHQPISLRNSHIRSAANHVADTLSRCTVPDDWNLTMFQHFNQLLSPFTIARFASANNALQFRMGSLGLAGLLFLGF